MRTSSIPKKIKRLYRKQVGFTAYFFYILFCKKMSIEKHHMIPISLYWPDEKENIIELEYKKHLQLHQTLDIPTNQYSKWTRKIKKDTNGKTIRTPTNIETIHDLQCLFFSKFDLLESETKNKNIQKMKQYAKREIERAFLVWIPKIKIDWLDFYETHNIAKEARKEKHKKIIDDMKKIYWI